MSSSSIALRRSPSPSSARREDAAEASRHVRAVLAGFLAHHSDNIPDMCDAVLMLRQGGDKERRLGGA